MGRLNSFNVAMVAFLGLVVFVLVLVLGGKLGRESSDEPSDPQATVMFSVLDPEQANYDPEVVAYATSQLLAIFNHDWTWGRGSAGAQPMLLYLTYLSEGSVNAPDRVDYCSRVLPLLTLSHSKQFQFLWTVLGNDNGLNSRIDQAVAKVGDQVDCQQKSVPAQQV